MALKVIAECVDHRTGKRYVPGPGVFFPDDADPDQVGRLVGAGCLKEVSAKEASAADRRAAIVSREEAEAEFRKISETLTAARETRDRELQAIADQVSKARQLADAQIADINREVETVKAKAQKDPAEIARQQVNEDGLFENTIEQLREIAEAEAVDLTGATRKDDIVAAIRAKRAAS